MTGNVRDNCYPHIRPTHTSALSIRRFSPPFTRCQICTHAYYE